MDAIERAQGKPSGEEKGIEGLKKVRESMQLESGEKCKRSAYSEEGRRVYGEKKSTKKKKRQGKGNIASTRTKMSYLLFWGIWNRLCKTS